MNVTTLYAPKQQTTDLPSSRTTEALCLHLHHLSAKIWRTDPRYGTLQQLWQLLPNVERLRHTNPGLAAECWDSISLLACRLYGQWN